MFKKRSNDFTITVWNGQGDVITQAPSSVFSFEETGIIRSSVEFYQDPEPCEIHRAAILSRSLAHFKLFCPMGETVAVKDLDPLLQALLPAQAVTIELKEADR